MPIYQGEWFFVDDEEVLAELRADTLLNVIADKLKALA